MIQVECGLSVDTRCVHRTIVVNEYLSKDGDTRCVHRTIVVNEYLSKDGKWVRVEEGELIPTECFLPIREGSIHA